MADQDNFAKALRLVRNARGLTQEDFSITSSRTYVSMLERGERSPTLAKVNDLCETLGVHPLVLLTLAYVASTSPSGVDKLLGEVRGEALSLLNAKGSTR